MGNEYRPDGWLIVKVTGKDPHYRVFGSWYEGYAYGDSWRFNSGIVGVEVEGDFYNFKGHSGSIYKCHKDCYGKVSAYNFSVVTSFCERSNGLMEILKEEPGNILNIDWIIG